MEVRIASAAKCLLLLLVVLLLRYPLHAQTCSGTPSPGTVTAAAPMVCAGEEMKLFISGFSSGTDIVVQWQSSADQAVWSDISDATDTPYIYKLPNAFIGMYYRAKVTCTGSGLSAYTNVVQIKVPNFAQPAPLPYTESFDGDWIKICKAGILPQPLGTGINWFNWPAAGNSSWRRDDRYEDGDWSSDFGGYTPASTTGDHSARFHSTYGTAGYLDLYLNAGNTLDPELKKLSFDYINTDGTDQLVIWLSVNGGADFVRLDSVATAAQWTKKDIFFSTYSSNVVIRFMGVADNGNSDIGLDNVRVAAAYPCTGTPVINGISADKGGMCSGASVTMQLDGMSGNTDGVIYQWQTSPDNGTTWMDVAGAVTEKYTTALTATTWFRMQATCIFSKLSSVSNVLQVTITPAVSGTDYTINKALPTGGNNFASFNDAYNFLKCGISGPVVFTVAPASGPYNEQLILEGVQGASATNTITFNGNGNAIVWSGADDNERAVIKLRGASFFTFNNLVINAVPAESDRDNYFGVGVHLLQNADDNTFRGCTILTDTISSSYNYYGVVINGSNKYDFDSDGFCDRNLFEEDTIVGGQYNVYMTANMGAPNTNNHFNKNVFRDAYSRGFSLRGAAATYLENNTFTSLLRNSFFPAASVLSYIYIEGLSFGTYISKNRFTHPFGPQKTGINAFFGIFDGTSNSTPGGGLVVTNNVFYDISHCETISAIFSGTPGGVFLHNTIDINYTTTTAYGTLTGIRLGSSANGATLRNNIVSITHNGAGEAYAVLTFGSSINSDNSDYYITGTGNNNLGQVDAAKYKTLADWKAGTGGDKSSVDADPAYVNAAAGDLHPTERKVNNIGSTTTGVGDDITGAARSATAPDPGAYEFTPVGCDPLHGNYTIDQNAPASATNFISFNAARSALECGVSEPVVFDVKPGDYHEQVVFTGVYGASAINTITFKGNGQTIHFSSTNTNERAVIKLKGASHFVFDSLTIDAAPKGTTDGYFGYAVQLLDNADSNVVKNSNILADTTWHNYSPDFGAIVLTPGEDGLDADGDTRCDGDSILHNRISGGATSVLITGNTNGMVIKDNQVLNFAIMGISLRYGVKNAVVEANYISRPYRVEAGFWGVMVWGTGDASNLSITRNTITRGFSPVIQSSGCHAIYIYGLNNNGGGICFINNNLIYNMHAQGGQFQGITLEKSKTVIVQHNTISIDSTENYPYTGAYGIYATYAIDGYVTNNLVSITRTGPGQRAAVYFQMPTNGLLFERNNYYMVDDPNNFTGIISFYDHYKTLADWQKVSGTEANTFTIDPAFVDITNGDLTPGSEAIDNLGLQRGVLIDIYNRPRSFTTPDMGALEFTVYPCTAPPEAGKTVVSPATASCMGTALSLSLNGNSTGAGQRYIWQRAASPAGPWTNISDTLITVNRPFVTELTPARYFRCMVTCSGKADSSDVVAIALNAGMPQGVYTINGAAATDYPTGKNFHTFQEAVAAMACGIEGPVLFRVASGTYEEQVHIPKIPNASRINTVRFESATGNNRDVTVRYAAASNEDNYVLHLDSASFISFHNMSVTPAGSSYANAVVITGGSSWDTLGGCRILLPVTTVAPDDEASLRITGVLARQVTGGHNVIRNNEIVNGSRSIYISGKTDVQHAAYNQITGNILDKPFGSGVEMRNVKADSVSGNSIHITGGDNATVYGIRMVLTDSVFYVSNNSVVLDHLVANSSAYGIMLDAGNAAAENDSRITGNRVLAMEENKCMLFGLAIQTIKRLYVANNAVHIKTTNLTSQGLYHISSGIKYYNNTIQNGTENADSYVTLFNETGGAGTVIKNNIFSATGGGKALYIVDPAIVTSDYNMLYSSGSALAGSVNGSMIPYATLNEWTMATGNDRYSIVYKPAFADDSLKPALNSPDVWAMHGRGVQIAGNATDFYGKPRPVTLQEGVPDLGAYEFVPSSVPVALTAVPAAPAAGTQQVFYLGTDTVMKVNWRAGSTVPAAFTVRRYSGVAPQKLAAGQAYMYFYTSAEGGTNTGLAADVQQYYLDPWQGYIPAQDSIKLGKTNAAGAWVVNNSSRVNALSNVIAENNLTALYQFTGLLNGKAVVPPVVNNGDSSNSGTEFWAAYGHHQRFETDNMQEMQLLMSTGDKEAHVVVTIPGTGWQQEYTIAPRTAISSGNIPKAGSYDARITGEGVYNRGIHITSDVPVQVAEMIGRPGDVNSNAAVEESGATLLLPAGAYGYEYQSLIAPQYASDHAWSWINVVAAYDSTVVEITPSQDTRGGHKAGDTYTVVLRKGEVYQIMGRLYSAVQGYDLTGTVVRSAKNAAGRCYPVAVFSGSSATSVVCESGLQQNNTPVDNLVQQLLPYRAWGKHYRTAPVMSHHDEAAPLVSVYRIMVKEADTKVTVNGTVLDVTKLINHQYYTYQSATADDITADKPVMVAQYMISTSGCPGSDNDDGASDAEIFYLTPAEHGLKKVVFFRHNIGFNGMGLDGSNTLSLIIPDAGVSTLAIDGSTGFYAVYPCANMPGYSQVVKRWNLEGRDAADRNTTFTIESEYAFTGITYGLGVSESYGYNLGMKTDTGYTVSTLAPAVADTAVTACGGVPVYLHAYLNMKPAAISWQVSGVAGAVPAANITETAPAAQDSVVVNGKKQYLFVSSKAVAFADTGVHYVPVLFTDERIEGCDHTLQTVLAVYVAAKPFANFTVPSPACVGELLSFAPLDTAASGTNVAWAWSYGDGKNSATHTGANKYNLAGQYDVKFSVTGSYGCVKDTVKTVTITDCRTSVFVPNTFTPNGDGNNDMLKVYAFAMKGMHLMIFNQWGQKIFETTNREEGWDGNFKGAAQPSGVYIYVCSVTLTDGSQVVKKGSVNLIR